MNLSLIPMTNKSHVRLIFAKDVCVYTLRRSIKSFLFLVIVFSCFWFIVLFNRVSILSINTATTDTTTAKTLMKPIPVPHPNEPSHRNFPNVHDSKKNHLAQDSNVIENVRNYAYQTLIKNQDTNTRDTGKISKEVSFYGKND